MTYWNIKHYAFSHGTFVWVSVSEPGSPCTTGVCEIAVWSMCFQHVLDDREVVFSPRSCAASIHHPPQTAAKCRFNHDAVPPLPPLPSAIIKLETSSAPDHHGASGKPCGARGQVQATSGSFLRTANTANQQSVTGIAWGISISWVYHWNKQLQHNRPFTLLDTLVRFSSVVPVQCWIKSLQMSARLYL